MTEPGQALTEAKLLAKRLIGNGPMAMTVSKLVMDAAGDWSSDDIFERQNELTAPVFNSHAAKEGAKAFCQKSKPLWRGE